MKTLHTTAQRLWLLVYDFADRAGFDRLSSLALVRAMHHAYWDYDHEAGALAKRGKGRPF